MIKSSSIFTFITICALAIGTISASPALPVTPASTPPILDFTTVVSGLTRPVFVTNADDHSNRLFIVQQGGQILVFKNGGLISTPFLDISGLSNFTDAGNEQGLLGLAFDPNYASNGYFYVTYTTNTGGITCPFPNISTDTCDYTTTLARYHISSNADVADPTSGRVLLSIPKIWDNHNGGMIAFGPDGYLYMSMGDGGNGGDPRNSAQDTRTLLGKLLRLDVDSTFPYTIPPTNPFYSSSAPNVKKEIWAYGLRNPWRFSFDRSTHDLYIGDVGQDTEEEVDFQPHTSTGGQNYGWNIREGNLCYNPSSGCVNPPHYVAPVATYLHTYNHVADSYGCAITGGYVYRGSSSALKGTYFYGDYCSGKILGLVKNSNNTWTSSLLASTSYNISSFGEDEQGELYLTDLNGQVVKITHHPTTITSSFISQATYDGWVLASTVVPGTGGSMNAAGTLRVGDDASNKQYRSILYFNTAALPDNAVIHSVTLKIYKAGAVGTNPLTLSAFGSLLADIKKGTFGTAALQTTDFQAAASASAIGHFSSIGGSWYQLVVPASDYTYINLTGVTQFRLRFTATSNNNSIANYDTFYAGDATTSTNRPLLGIQYYIP